MKNINEINKDANSIELDVSFEKIELAELTGITTGGGGMFKVWRSKGQVHKIVEEVGLSYGRIRMIS